ncbi:spore germination protein [Ectobacillus funiculus]|uniref:spore germination protein n=1 Tax=Ectobacillus funiculus TaxID=137993 RepID=UPI003979E5BE
MLKSIFQWMKQFANTDTPHKDKDNPQSSVTLIGNLTEDLQQIKLILDNCSDIVFHPFQIGTRQEAVLIFLDGLVNMQVIDSDILQPLLRCEELFQGDTTLRYINIKNFLMKQVISVAQTDSGNDVQQIVDHVLSGDTVLLADQVEQAIFISAKEWDKRAIEEPATEPVIRGPREGFTENLRTNTSLIRRRLKTPQLKMEAMKVGQLSKTDIVITYLSGIAMESVVSEVRERLNRIDIDAILESGYIEELIKDSPFSLFPQAINTERPDRLVGCLLEGQVGIIIDNTPFALIVPVTFYGMLNASEDYYQNFLISSVIRWLRMAFLVVALLLPSIYIAITTYHQEMLPTVLLLSVASSRETVPFPAIVEAFLMEISFEGLREAGVRLPRPVGQAVSIVGALVIGQAAVQAGIVSAPLVIIVSMTGIASFIFPIFSQAMAIRMLRFPMMLLAGTLGLYGIFMGVLFLLIYMLKIRSFGVPYLSPMAPANVGDFKDVFVRVPWWSMKNRPSQTGKKNSQRMSNSLRSRFQKQ